MLKGTFRDEGIGSGAAAIYFEVNNERMKSLAENALLTAACP